MRHRRDRLALLAVAVLLACVAGGVAVALTCEPVRDFLIFWFYVLALLASG